MTSGISRQLTEWQRCILGGTLGVLALFVLWQSAPAQQYKPDSPGEKVPIVVLDPGHGGSDQGARGPSGLLEKDITLQAATEAARLIEQLLGLRVVLTRSDDSAMSLEARAAFANQAGGDLFISIHVGGSFAPGRRDFQTFYFDELQGLALSAGEGAKAMVPPMAGEHGQLPQPVLWEQAQLDFLETSQMFARLLQKNLRAQVAEEGHGVFGLPLLMLRWVRMPAVLLDLGSVNDPAFEEKLRSEAYIQRAALGITQAVNDYYALR